MYSGYSACHPGYSPLSSEIMHVMCGLCFSTKCSEVVVPCYMSCHIDLESMASVRQLGGYLFLNLGTVASSWCVKSCGGQFEETLGPRLIAYRRRQ